MLRTDVRLIAATNVDLRRHASQGRFRQDLLDRLAFEVIVLPPLRARRDDIKLLADHFAGRMAVELGRSEPPEFSAEARRMLLEHPWPGNVRELKNVVERMVYRQSATRIESIDFDPFDSPWMPRADPAKPDNTSAGSAPIHQTSAAPPEPNPDPALPLAEAVRRLEVERLREALATCRFNQRQAAQRLGLSYHQFRGYYRKYHDDLKEG